MSSRSPRGKTGRRRRSRQLAVQMLYQHELGGREAREVVQNFDPDDASLGGPEPPLKSADSRESLDYARTLFEGTVEHRGQVDELIEAGATNWRIVRMPAVDRSILRLAVYELLFEKDVPKIVVVDEAIELAKRFGSEQSASFVNGVLDGLVRAKRFPGSLN